MHFYNIKDEYVEYLREFDYKVAENKKGARPYVGIVLEINGIKYYAPLSSPKSKHFKMKNTKDFYKINQGKYGVINLNNMIPVMDEVLVDIVINDIEDEKLTEFERRVKTRTCNLPLMERVYNQYMDLHKGIILIDCYKELGKVDYMVCA